MLKHLRAFLLAGAIAAICASPASAVIIDLQSYKAWGLDTESKIESSLKLSSSPLYSETISLTGTRSGGQNGKAYVWDESTQFRVLNLMAQINPSVYTSKLRSFSDALVTSHFSNGAYAAGAGGSSYFYDDNAHMVVALVEAYRITKDPVYLTRAKATETFVLSGEDTVAGGGIYFVKGESSTTGSKNAISTLQGARGAAMLYRATGDSTYLADAQRLMGWANTHIKESNGLYFQGYDIATSTGSGVDLVNSAGTAISADLEMYDGTGTITYLTQAELIANAALGRYVNSSTSVMNDEGYWAYELVDAFDNLYMHDHNIKWLNVAAATAAYLHDSRADSNGHFATLWGRGGAQTTVLSTWSLNDQAAVDRAYLFTGLVPEPGSLMVLAIAGGFALSRRRALNC